MAIQRAFFLCSRTVPLSRTYNVGNLKYGLIQRRSIFISNRFCFWRGINPRPEFFRRSKRKLRPRILAYEKYTLQRLLYFINKYANTIVYIHIVYLYKYIFSIIYIRISLYIFLYMRKSLRIFSAAIVAEIVAGIFWKFFH